MPLSQGAAGRDSGGTPHSGNATGFLLSIEPGASPLLSNSWPGIQAQALPPSSSGPPASPYSAP
eukprot:10842034-Heterocapsa_arctica.AAC.1